MTGLIPIGVVGAGYWGSKLGRILHESPTFWLRGTADSAPGRGDCSLGELLSLVDAVAIATPATTHEDIAAHCLAAGVHVLVEKPLALSGLGARLLVDLARDRDLVLMVDHTYVYGPALETVRAALLDLGPVYSMASARMHDGGPTDVDSMWDLLPHDLSILQTVAPGWWQRIPDVEVVGNGEAGLVTMWWGARTCRVQYSRRSPSKVRHFSFGTAEGEVRWTDWPSPVVLLDRHGLSETRLPIPDGEPLRRCVEAFGEAILTGEEPPTSGARSLMLIDTIEAAAARLGAMSTI